MAIMCSHVFHSSGFCQGRFTCETGKWPAEHRKLDRSRISLPVLKLCPLLEFWASLCCDSPCFCTITTNRHRNPRTARNPLSLRYRSIITDGCWTASEHKFWGLGNARFSNSSMFSESICIRWWQERMEEWYIVGKEKGKGRMQFDYLHALS